LKAKTIFIILLQILGASVGFLLSLMIPSLLLPMSKTILDATPASGFLTPPAAMLLNGLVNAVILVWAGRRSSYTGLALWAQLLVLSFGAQVFMTQIETAYFLPAFPLLHGNYEVYRIVLRGLLTSLLVTLLVTLLVGGFSRRARARAQFTLTNDDAVKSGSWLAVAYIALYVLFGYYVAWQSQELRLFYGGPAVLNSFFAQWGQSLMDRPEILVFQYFRGVLWLLCLIPVFKGFTGKRLELVVLSALALGLLPTMQLAFANPLMPATISFYHFIEVSLSTGIFAALCAWFVPQGVRSAAQP
jgi:hypothetical protein